ncbi:MAG: hypothetical protein OER86_10110, partial [Phycisphaerae bacterium]|nr:hypothetical protein [Phycisphaerae bacterium]
ILKERLKADPKDTDSARELVRALVVDLDDPTAARKYSFLLPDDTERATIKLAAKPAEMRTAAEALAVARWYEGLAKSNEATHMLPMYKRAAESYLQSLIRSIASQDLAHVHARIALTNITQVIEKLETDLPGAALNPVAWTTGAAIAYSFDKDSISRGLARNAAARQGNARVFGSQLIAGKVGDGAIQLTGKNSYVQVPPMALGAGTTVATWVKMTQRAADYTRIFDFGTGQYESGLVLAFDEGRPQLMHFPGRGTKHIARARNRLTVGEWAHTVTVFGKDRKGHLYVNGELAASADVGRSAIRTRSRMYIGRSNHADHEPFHGAIDEFVIWRRALGPKEIKQLAAYTRKGGSVVTAIANGGIPREDDGQQGVTLRSAWSAYFLANQAKRGEAALALIDALTTAGATASETNDWATTESHVQQALAVARKSAPTHVASIEKTLGFIAARRETSGRIADLKKKLTDDPLDQTALQSLARIHLLELNDPQRAASLAEQITDATLKERLVLATRKPADLEDAQATEMASWFRNLANGTNDISKATAYGRALRYYRAVIARHREEDDPARLAADLARAEIQTLLQGLPAEAREAAHGSLWLKAGVQGFARRVAIRSSGYQMGNFASISIDDEVIIEGKGGSRDSLRGVMVVAVKGGDVSLKRAFDTAHDSDARDAFAKAIGALAEGTYVVMAACDNAAGRFHDGVHQAVLSVGGREGFYPKNESDRKKLAAYYLIGRKGLEAGKAIEVLDRTGGPAVYPPPTIDVPKNATLAQFKQLVRIVSAGNSPALRREVRNRMSIAIGDQSIMAGRGYGDGGIGYRGINLVAVHEGELVTRGTFDFYGDRQAPARFAGVIESLPAGTLVAIAVADEASRLMTDEARAAIRSLGGQKGPSSTLHAAYILVGQKGAEPGQAVELIDVKGGPIVYPQGK